MEDIYIYSLFSTWYLTFGLCIGIELVLGTRVKSADVRRKTLLTATGETISYKILIIATGARVLKTDLSTVNYLVVHQIGKIFSLMVNPYRRYGFFFFGNT